MIFKWKNPAGEIYEFDVIKYDINLHRDPLKPHTCKLQVDKRVPINIFDIIEVSDIGGHIPFRGYVTNLTIPASKTAIKTIECESIETALNHRYIPCWVWNKTMTVGDVLSSTVPTSPTIRIPLVWFAQSYIPEAAHEFYYHKTNTGYPYGDPNVTILRGAGRKSRIGEKDIWVYGTKATEYDSFEDIPESGLGGAFVRDDDDIWMVFFGNVLGTSPKGCLAQNYGMAADMAFDLGVRVRDLDNASDAIEFDLVTDHDAAWETIVNFAKKFSLNTHIFYHSDGFTYIDFLTSSGRGESDGFFTVYENDINVEPLLPSLKKTAAVIGLGMGDGNSRQIASRYDLGYRGVWTEELLDIDNGLAGGIQNTATAVGNMQSTVDAHYAARNTDLGYRIKLDPSELIPYPTDSIGLIDSLGHKNVFEVKKIRYSSDNPFVLVDIGTTPYDLYDAFQAAGRLDTVGGEKPYISEDPYTDSQDMTFGDIDTACSPATYTMSFDTGEGYFDNCRVMISFSYSLPACMTFPIGSNSAVTSLGRCWVEINGNPHSCYAAGAWTVLGKPVTMADVTELFKLDGTTETIKFYVVSYGYFVGAPPTVSVSMTITAIWPE